MCIRDRRAAEPSESQLQELLSAWLKAKAALLAGDSSPTPLESIARPNLINDLQRQLEQNRARGEREEMEATITGLTIRARTAIRLEAAATLRYSDARLTSSGKVLNRTPSSELRNLYVFGRDGEIWRVAAFRPGS